MKVACLHFQSPQDLQALGDIFYRATPQILKRGDRTLFLEISKTRALYSEEKFIRRAKLTLARLGLAGRIGIAPDVPTALALAIHGTRARDPLPVEALEHFVDPLMKHDPPPDALRLLIRSLKSLGFLTVGDFRRIPPAQLSSRFGALGLMAHERVQGRIEVPWPAFEPSKTLEERHEFDPESPVDNLEPIFFTLRPLQERLFLRLRGQGKRARRFDVILKQEHPSKISPQEYRVSILLQLPYVSPKAVFQITRERIEAQVRALPLQHRLTSVQVTVTELAPYFENQRDLFDQKKEENDESFFQLVSRLGTKLGEGRAFFAQTRESYLPEKNWRRLGEYKESERSESHVPARPLRLLPKPVPVRISETRLFLPSGTEEIVAFDNIETIFSDWWENPVEKLYFRLHTRSGQSLWIFKTTEGCFLHGMFD